MLPRGRIRRIDKELYAGRIGKRRKSKKMNRRKKMMVMMMRSRRILEKRCRTRRKGKREKEEP